MVSFALKRPITIIVIFLGILLFSIISIFTIPIDIFPKLNSPTIYVIEPVRRNVSPADGGIFCNAHAGSISVYHRRQEHSE